MKTRLHLFVILTLLTSGPGCSRHGSASNLQNVPIHVDVVCYNKTGTLDSAQKVAAFDAWAASAIHQPGSTFTVWVVGDDRNACRQDFVACVPGSWGGDVLEAKSAFLQTARARVGQVHPLSPQGAHLRKGGEHREVV